MLYAFVLMLYTDVKRESRDCSIFGDQKEESCVSWYGMKRCAYFS